MKKLNKNNKGFSLVELLVVIAIMVVLIGVVAPSLLGNIEKAREAKDIQALDTIASNIQAAMTNEDVYDAVVAKGTFDLKDAYAATAFTDATANKRMAVALNDALDVGNVYSGATFSDTDEKATIAADAKIALVGSKKAKTGTTIKISITTTGNVKVSLTNGTNVIKGKSVDFEVER